MCLPRQSSTKIISEIFNTVFLVAYLELLVNITCINFSPLRMLSSDKWSAVNDTYKINPKTLP